MSKKLFLKKLNVFKRVCVKILGLQIKCDFDGCENLILITSQIFLFSVELSNILTKARHLVLLLTKQNEKQAISVPTG
jgi:hypothetical protein